MGRDGSTQPRAALRLPLAGLSRPFGADDGAGRFLGTFDSGQKFGIIMVFYLKEAMARDGRDMGHGTLFYPISCESREMVRGTGFEPVTPTMSR